MKHLTKYIASIRNCGFVMSLGHRTTTACATIASCVGSDWAGRNAIGKPNPWGVPQTQIESAHAAIRGLGRQLHDHPVKPNYT